MDEVPAIEIVNINPGTELSPGGFRTRKYENRKQKYFKTFCNLVGKISEYAIHQIVVKALLPLSPVGSFPTIPFSLNS